MKKIGLIVLLIAVSGCATTASINYKVDSPKQADKNISVTVKEVLDDRPTEERGIIGDMINGYGNVMGQVSEPPTLHLDLKKALEAELSNSGYSLTTEETGIVIQPTLKFLSCDTSNRGKGHMRLHMMVTEGGQEVINHVYDAKEEVLILMGYAANKTITVTTKKVIGEFIKDLDIYAKS